MNYTPSDEILYKYARVLVNFALGDGKGVKPGQVVLVNIPESAKPFYVPLRNTILKAGAHAIMQYQAEGVSPADFYQLTSEEQRTFFPRHYYKGLIQQIDHSISIIAEFDKFELKDVDPKKLMQRSIAMKPYKVWREQKEGEGKFSWTLGLYGTHAMAADARLSEEEYWQQIITACFLDQADPVQAWRVTTSEIERIRGRLNSLEIEQLHVEGDCIDLHIGVGPGRQWLGGSGANIPSFEIFISPDWRQTSGQIYCDQPLYYFGNLIKGIELTFKQGKLLKATAEENQALLNEIISSPGGDRLGEYSLTDKRFSKISRFMGETLYDENVGQPNGNTHVALGSAYKDSYPGDIKKMKKSDWKSLGYNESPVHVDVISTLNRKVTAHLKNGQQTLIYQDGTFVI